ncbi:hypothetical protein BDN67DRAFT_1000520 [Paxillus ammoniavirescens]|nr:hypothetical protein BDN67DRAFT_1000520 [Paxillus ammoniavirescens]
MKPREYCCCAIPLTNAGIYTTLTEQFVLAIVVGTLSVATPSIVGAATPSFAPWLLALFCYVAAAIQILGFLGVAQEKAIMYRRYVTLHTGSTIVVFAIAAVWAIISAARHPTAQSNCESTYFPTNDSNVSTSSEGQTLCDIFSWVDVGLMGGAWLFFAVVQTYLLTVVSSYGAAQREDHEKYDALNDSTKPLTDDIPMADRGDPWDSRASHEFDYGRTHGHSRNESTASTVTGAPIRTEAYPDGGYGGYSTASHHSQHQQLAREPSTRRALSPPSDAYVQPTSYAINDHTGQSAPIGQPALVQHHHGGC